MADVQSRSAPRGGRGAGTRGRGGISARGRGAARSHGDSATTSSRADTDADADDEIAKSKKKYKTEIATIKEMFPNWSDEDIVFALQEANGSIQTTVERISEGTITPWGEVSNKKDKKSKDASALDSKPSSSRDTRESGRGGRGDRGRGRGADRGARGGRARTTVRDAPPTTTTTTSTTTRKENAPVDSVPTGDFAAWDTQPPADETAKSADRWADAPAVASAAHLASSIIPDGVKKSWASMFAPPPAAAAPTSKKAPQAQDESVVPDPPRNPPPTDPRRPSKPTEEAAPAPPPENLPSLPLEVATPPVEEPAINLTPSKDELTETNLEQVPDVSHPVQTATAASTAASSWDPRNAGTPFAAGQPSRPPTSGYQASALKATGASARTPSFQRRILDQEEAVRMPGNRELDRAAVQFGAFNLTGAGEDDVDGDREEPETRAQPPQHSPVAPRAALPPAPTPAAEGLPTPKSVMAAAAAPSGTQMPELRDAMLTDAAAPGLPPPQGTPLTSRKCHPPVQRCSTHPC